MKDVDRIQRESDVVQLRQMALVLARENARLVAKVVDLTKKLASATGADKAQLELELAALEAELSKADDSRPKNEGRGARKKSERSEKQPGHGPRPQPKLEQTELLWTLDEADLACPSCGERLAEWEGNTADSDEIDVIERRFVVRRHRRQKYRCKCGHCETALGPKRWFAGGRYSVAFVIAVALAKYLDHIPLERQCRQMSREGLTIDSNTLFEQLWALSQILRPAYERLPSVQRSRPFLHVDETTWPMLDGGKNWQIWDVVSDVAAYYSIRNGRNGAQAEALPSEYSGYVMTDGYVVYDSLAKQFPELKHCSCLVHARRKFVECSTQFPKETERILDLIGKLYEIEGRATSTEDRRRLRDTESRAVVAALQRALLEVRCLPGSALHKAIQYTSKRWSKLTRFLDDPIVPLDNNAAERALRGPVVDVSLCTLSLSARNLECAIVSRNSRRAPSALAAAA